MSALASPPRRANAARVIRPATLALCLALGGCSGVSSYGVATSPKRAAPTQGAVLVYAANPPPSSATELGIVEARAPRGLGTVDELFPELVRRAQQLGANAVVIDYLGARFEWVNDGPPPGAPMLCSMRGCTGLDAYPQMHEEMTVVLRGRALLVAPEAER